jgi:hypothetical protein
MNSQNVWWKQTSLAHGDLVSGPAAVVNFRQHDSLSTLSAAGCRLFLCCYFFSVGPAFAQIIPANRSAPWEGNVGVPGGIPYRTSIYKNIVTDLGADPTGAQDCAPIIERAISSCPPGKVVYIPAGTFTLKSRVYVANKSNITLRGAGAGVTVIKSTSDNGYILLAGAGPWPPPSTWIPIRAGATKGSNIISVSNTSNFTVGVQMCIGPNGLPSWAHNLGGNQDSMHTMGILFRVVSKTSSTVTFEPPLPFDFSGMNPAALAYPKQTTVEGIGLESFTMDMFDSNASWGLQISSAWGSWVKDVEVRGAYGRIMYFSDFIRGEVRQCYTHDQRTTGSNHEGIDFGTDCCWNLVEDNICNTDGPPVVFGDAGNRCAANVVAYNYILNPHQVEYSWDITFNHGPHNMLNLAEGNVMHNFKDDGYFGSSSHNTLFRNRIDGKISLKHFSNYYNIVGNVLGTTGVPAYETEQVNYNFSTIYELGFPNIGNHTYSGMFGPTTPPNYSGLPNKLTDPDNQKLDRNVKATILRHGNFDYFNNSTVWDSSISDHTLPASLYYSRRPLWWPDTIPWPPIGPDRTPMASQIPAKYRFVNGMPTLTPTSSATSSSALSPQIKNNKKKQYNKKKPKIQKQRWPSALLLTSRLWPS